MKKTSMLWYTLAEFQRVVEPMGLLDVKDYFSHLVKFFQLGVGEGFIRQEHLDNLMVDSDTEMLMNKLSDYKPITMTKWLEDIKIESK